jgi:hypothetical protein
VIHVHQVTAQQVVHTETEIHVQVPDRHQIVASAVTVRAIPVQVLVRLLIVANAVTVHVTRVQVPIDQQVARTVIAIPVRRHVQVLIVQQVAHTETATRAHLQIVQPVVHTVTATHVRRHVQVPIVHVAKILMVAIARAQAMIAMPVRLRVTANAVAVQIVPEVVFPMIAKSVHAVALAKSA